MNVSSTVKTEVQLIVNTLPYVASNCLVLITCISFVKRLVPRDADSEPVSRCLLLLLWETRLCAVCGKFAEKSTPKNEGVASQCFICILCAKAHP